MNEKIEKLRSFDASKYESIDLDRLVMYAVVQLEKLGVELSLENIIVASFKIFPKKFSLVGYPEFPDATRVEKSLWRCKGNQRRWLGGKTPQGYFISDRGRIISVQAEHQLANPGLRKKKAPSKTRRKERILAEVTSSSAYAKHVQGKGDSISEAEFCFLLQGTLDSDRGMLKDNFNSLKRIAEELERKEVSNFLTSIEQRFMKFLDGK